METQVTETQAKQGQSVKTTVLISYNQIDGYGNGWHGDGKVFVHANADSRWGSENGSGSSDRERASSVMGSLRHNFYGSLSVPVKDVDVFYIYAGLNAMESALGMARQLKEMVPEAKVAVVACDCDWGQKQQILRGSGIELLSCGCGGQSKMGRIAEMALAG